MRSFRAFVRLSRLKFLAGGLIGGGLGSLVAYYERGSIDLGAYALAQITITAAHLMTQYANDYYDRESDAITTRTPFSGGSGSLVDGSLDPRVALVAALVCLSVNLCGVLVLVRTDHAVAGTLGAACALFAWLYSAPPVRLLARGLGELDSSFVVGVLVPVCAYAAQTGTIDLRILASTLPAAAAMLAMMICVEVPDLAADEATGKRNLVVRFGLWWGAAFGIAALSAFPIVTTLALVLGAPATFAAWEFAAVVPGVWLGQALFSLRGASPVASAVLAGRGVTFFLTVALLGIIGYARALL